MPTTTQKQALKQGYITKSQYTRLPSRGSVVIPLPDGKKVEDWAIRRRAPMSVMTRIWRRLRD